MWKILAYSYGDRMQVVCIWVVLCVLRVICFVLCRTKTWSRYDEMMVGNTYNCSGNVKKVLDYTYMMIWYDKKMIEDTGYCSGNVKNGHDLFKRDGLIMDMTKT